MLFVYRALVTCIHTHVLCVYPKMAMCTLSTTNYNTVHTFQEVLTLATEALITCFGMFVRTNIVVSFKDCVFLSAGFWHQSAQYIFNYSMPGRL